VSFFLLRFIYAVDSLFYLLQIHTHMCYSNFNDIIHSIIDMDADVITIENSRSDEKLLSVFREGVKYGAGIGPGVYDIHSPRIPSTEEIADRINKMLAVLETNILWVNPDCGLKTRKYSEVKPALKNMVDAAKLLRTQLASAKWTDQEMLEYNQPLSIGCNLWFLLLFFFLFPYWISVLQIQFFKRLQITYVLYDES